jgi:hypothetical protein
MKTMTVLGEVRLTGRIDPGNELGVMYYQPADVYLQNDGVQRFWMSEGLRYELARDAVGWVVTGPSLDASHTYRLASHGEYTDRLPLVVGTVDLEPANRYELVARGRSWELHEIA